jgi:hypothetical protein
VAVALARQQPELVQESVGIGDMWPMLASSWLHEEYLKENRGYWQAKKVADRIGRAKLSWDSSPFRI